MIKEVNLELFYERIDYYHFTLMGFALAGIVGYLLLSKEQRKNKAINLSLGLLVLIAFYELLGAFVSSQKIVNFWVYNLFNSRLAGHSVLSIDQEFSQKDKPQKDSQYLDWAFSLPLTGITSHSTGSLQ
jgi:hypothetical protein